MIPRFSHNFFVPHVSPVSGYPERQSGTARVVGPPIVYSEETYGEYREFMSHDDCEKQLEQLRSWVDFLQQFSGGDKQVQACLQEFIDHLDDPHYFDTEAKHIRSTGVQLLYQFCCLIDTSTRIDEKDRRTAIRNLSEGMTVCAPGIVSNIVAATRELVLAEEGGLRARLWRVKEDITRQCFLERVSECFEAQEDFIGNQIHYVNAVWNYAADALGLEKIRDSFAPQFLTPEFLEYCLSEAKRNLRPEQCALRIAEECLSGLTSALKADEMGSLDLADAVVRSHLEQTVRDQSARLGLLEREDQLRLADFVILRDDGICTLNKDPTLIAVGIMRVMSGLHLLDQAPRAESHWLSGRNQVTLYVAGGDDGLVWLGRGPARRGVPPEVGWSARLEIELSTVDELQHWHPHAEEVLPPLAARRQAMAASTVESLILLTPPEWLNDSETALRFFGRLDDRSIDAYIRSRFDEIADGIEPEWRLKLAVDLMGRCEAASTLVERWYPDPLALASMPYGDSGESCLQHWMQKGNSRAIDALGRAPDGCRRLSAGSSLQALFSALKGSAIVPALHRSMVEGDVEAIQAWHRLLVADVELLRGMPSSTADLCALLAATDAIGWSGLASAVALGQVHAIKAFHQILADPRIHPNLDEQHLIPLFAAPGVYFALEKGQADAIRAFHDILVDPRIAPYLEGQLSKLLMDSLTAKNPDGTSGLALALRQGHTEAINALHQVLLIPCLRHQLPKQQYELLSAKDNNGVSGLCFALMEGRTGAIGAFFRILTDPGIFPHFSDAQVNDLLEARDETGEPAAWRALGMTQIEAVRELNAGIQMILEIMKNSPPMNRNRIR